MRRVLEAVLLFTFLFPAIVSPQTETKKKPKPPCKATLADCPDEGCGSQFDPNLNLLKNIRSKEGEATPRTLAWMKKLDDPENFSQGDTREELATLGEGKKITVVAYLLVAKPEGAESCNCGLKAKEDTDNHLVLVSKATVDKFPVASTAKANSAVFHSRELESETAEFTPRVRLDHLNFTRETMQPLIRETKQKALLVRVTGQLLFDSEHFIKHHLVRVNNWEIHPILELEFCEMGNTCKVGGKKGWKSIDDTNVAKHDNGSIGSPDGGHGVTTSNTKQDGRGSIMNIAAAVYNLFLYHWAGETSGQAQTIVGPSWTTVAVVTIIAASLTFIGYAGTIALRHIGGNAFVSGSNPQAPEAFSAFFLQSARIAMVGVIVLATVVLSLTGKLTEGAIGILSGVAGYVLGGVRPSVKTSTTGK